MRIVSSDDRWEKCLESLCDGYQLEDIFNADAIGLHCTALLSRYLVLEGKESRGGKNSKDRRSVLLACSVVGEKFILLSASVLDLVVSKV